MALSTPHQRLHIRTLLRELDLSTLRVEDEHVRLAEAIGIKDWHPGKPLDDALRAITVEQARAFAKVCLSGEVPA